MAFKIPKINKNDGRIVVDSIEISTRNPRELKRSIRLGSYTISVLESEVQKEEGVRSVTAGFPVKGRTRIGKALESQSP